MNDTTKNTIFDAFLTQVKKSPNSVAIITAEDNITYSGLLEKVNLFSSQLLQSIQFSESKIAIHLEPSIDFVVSVLSCLKIGIPYIPLNTSYPQVHIETILENSQANFLISQRMFEFEKVLKIQQIPLHMLKEKNSIEELNLISSTSSDEAYIIYTSGSTGTPKGVIITHQSILELLKSTKLIYNINKNDRIPLNHSLAFDFSVWEIFSALINGATLVIPSETEKGALDLYLKFLKIHNITILNMTPVMFYVLLDQFSEMSTDDMLSLKLRLIILGGAPLKPPKLKNWFNLSLSKTVDVYNMYGITEGSIHSTYLKIVPYMALSRDSLIGKALPNVQIELLDNDGKTITTHDMVGELCLLGHSVSKGYLNQENNDQFFIHSNGQRGFKTGDLVKLHPSGNLQYLGRKDRRMKIRGFRVDPLEVENALLSTHQMKNAIVLLNPDDFRQDELICFLEAQGSTINISDIKKDLERILPLYMIPSRFIVVETFPINSNGKVDTAELLLLLNEVSNKEKPKSVISSEKINTLTIIKNIWEDTLGIEVNSYDQNFFDMGGNSLLLMKLHFEIQKNIDHDIILMELIQYPSINQFNLFLNHRAKAVKC